MMGADMLIKTLVKAVGLEPETFIPEMQRFTLWVKNSIVNFDERLTRIEQTNAQIAAQNAEFIAFMKANNPALLNHENLKEEIQNEQH